MKRLLISILATSSALLGEFPIEVSGQMRLKANRGDFDQALTHYISYSQEHKEHDYTLLQEMCYYFLLNGSKSSDPTTELMTLFGAGVARSPKLLHLLQDGLKSKDLKVQLISLNFLNQFEDDSANESLQAALFSTFLLTRLEACFQLAIKHEPHVVDHLQALYQKVPQPIHKLFPQILVHIDTPGSNLFLKQLLSHTNLQVRSETIMHLGKAKRDDFLPQIQKLATQKQCKQLEACAFALGEMGDTFSLPLLVELSESKQTPVRLAALCSRYALGDQEAIFSILKEAELGNLFAIAFLGRDSSQKSLQVLRSLVDHEEKNIALNALTALLQRQQTPPKHLIESLLLSDDKSCGFMQTHTPCGALQAWKYTSLIGVAKDVDPIAQATKQFKHSLLIHTLELDEQFFLSIARKIFEEKISHLVPPLVYMLSNLHTPDAIALLKEMSQKAGAPLIRNFCTLALYQLNEEGDYEERLLQWVKGEQKHQLIQLKEEKINARECAYALSADETSTFYLAVLEAIAQSQSEKGISTLLEILEQGNPLNRYALAGLLIRICD